MKVLKQADVGMGGTGQAELADAISAGQLVCVPHRGAYRLICDAHDPEAVQRLIQSKRRTKNHPALVLVRDLKHAATVVGGTEWTWSKRLAKRYWPGPLTLLLPPAETLAAPIRKTLARATGHIGVRAPGPDTIASQLLTATGRALLVSSANLEKKGGAHSAATIRQKFAAQIAVWLDVGDPPAEPASTLVEVTADGYTVTRAAAIDAAAIAALV